MNIQEFQKIIKDYYKEHKRNFVWRTIHDPYYILVSEIMLQQTQTFRVEPKFEAFIAAFPTFETLAEAPFAHVLQYWKGLGYNRRAKALQENAQRIIKEFNGILPDEPKILETFASIGYATSCSITTFAYNKPTAFIETNVRSVFIHFFFTDKTEVHDKEIMPLVHAAIDYENPREWYYALMDYGVMLKKQDKEINKKSKHYTKQSKFEGSDRQVRGKILEYLLAYKVAQLDELQAVLAVEFMRFTTIVDSLLKDQLIIKNNDLIKIVE